VAGQRSGFWEGLPRVSFWIACSYHLIGRRSTMLREGTLTMCIQVRITHHPLSLQSRLLSSTSRLNNSTGIGVKILRGTTHTFKAAPQTGSGSFHKLTHLEDKRK
jgi:hypothetical protein